MEEIFLIAFFSDRELRSCVIMILGRNLVGSMARESSKDTLDSTKRIHELIDSIELKKVSFSKKTRK